MKLQIVTLGLLLSVGSMAQKKLEQPKLVVGVVVDQMRYDYLNRYWDDFGDDGFKKLVKGGFTAHNLHYNYKPTSTGPGHASIFTGATPALHGIVGNNWYSKQEGRRVYCAESLQESGEYFMSPKRLKGRTLADQVKLSTYGRGKSFGISLKDRGAILPAGHMADGAFWFDSKSGKWISSNYYTKSNPKWLTEFNQNDFAETYLREDWSLSLDESDYTESNPDDNNFENELYEGSGVTFPYNLQEAYKKSGIGILKSIPQGNSMTTDLALLALKSESLGSDNDLDFLSVSYSATDYVGHRFGVGAREVQDTYVKLDNELAELLSALDQAVGEGNYVLFLTADHGAGEVRNHLKEMGAPHGDFDYKKVKEDLEAALDNEFGANDWVQSFINLNFYFNDDAFTKERSKDEVIHFAQKWLKGVEGVRGVWTPTFQVPLQDMNEMVINGYHPQESGDIILLEHSAWTSYSDKGSAHGSPYHYDTHVPLLIYGKGVKPSESRKYHTIISIAPTISQLLGIAAPDLSSGQHVIKEVFK